jgi:acylpyruvate hydrolase
MIMKIVAFEEQGGPRLGVIEGDQVVDLQAVDDKIPTDLGEWLRRTNGDLKTLIEISRRGDLRARRPVDRLRRYDLPVRRPGKILCLGLNYLEHVK